MNRPALFLLACFVAAYAAVVLRVAPNPVARAGTPAAATTVTAKQQAEQQRNQDAKKQEPPKVFVHARKSEPMLALLAARPAGASSRNTSGRGERTANYPLEFRAGEGETVGAIRALVTLPAAGWKFVKAEFAPGSRLKVSAQQEKKNRVEAGNGGETIELNMTAGAHVIRDGIIGELQFSLPAGTSTQPPAAPLIKLLATSPPQTEQVHRPAETPFEMPPSAPANPSVSCFFFSH